MHGTFTGQRQKDESQLNQYECDAEPGFNWGRRVYAIAFDLDTEQLQQVYGSESWQNAYADIRRALDKHGFTWKQGSVYFGGDGINSVSCVVAVQAMAKAFPWFRFCVRDIRMLRIEETNDLMPAVDAQSKLDL